MHLYDNVVYDVIMLLLFVRVWCCLVLTLYCYWFCDLGSLTWDSCVLVSLSWRLMS